MRLYDYYTEIAGKRGLPLKNVEDYDHPKLFWCDTFHIIEEDGNMININGPEMTNEEFWKYMDYSEYRDPKHKPFVGGDYIHHTYWKMED